MKSSFRSAAAETPEKPMSQVEPSPPQTTTVASPLPRSRSAALIPDASAAAEANGVRWTETPNALTGQMPAMIVQHEAGTTRTIFDSGLAAARPSSTCRMLIAGPQPAQAAWPGSSSFFSVTMSSSQTATYTTSSGTYTGPAFGAPRRPRLVQRPPQRVGSHVDAAHSADEVDGGLHVAEVERPHVGAERPERAERGGAVDHGDVGDACESGRQLRRRERPVRMHADDEEVVVGVEQLLRRVADRPDRDERRVRLRDCR